MTKLQIDLERLRDETKKLSFSSDGDSFERKYWPVFEEKFANLERFWRVSVVPTSRRIECDTRDAARHNRRAGVDDDVWQVAYSHYSAFIHCVHAYECLCAASEERSFVEFYAHLGSVCDLVEDFLIRVHLLALECRDKKSDLLQKLSREEFLQRAGDLYDRSYDQLYEHYLAKGKGLPLKLPSRTSMVAEYLGKKSPEWRLYRDFSGGLRPYRNFVVHDVALGKISRSQSSPLVPKRERLGQYKKLTEVFDAAQDAERVANDFIPAEDQMALDFTELQSTLNAVWERPIDDFNSLLYQERNPILLKKYGIEPTG